MSHSISSVQTLSYTVIIPTLNRPEDLRHALDSIFRQTFYPQEIIVVDQSSTQETSRLVQQMKKQADSLQIRLLYLKFFPPGLTRARNEGIVHASGDYITFLDDDVVLDRNYFAQINETIKRRGALVVQGKISNY